MIQSEEAAHYKIIKEIHDSTCLQDKDYYRDPFTNNLVFTKIKHLKRGYCCRNICRHCPYGTNPKAIL
jgi:hypothetical protein